MTKEEDKAKTDAASNKLSDEVVQSDVPHDSDEAWAALKLFVKDTNTDSQQ